MIWHTFLSCIKLFDKKLTLPEIPISNEITFRTGPMHESYNKHPLFDKHKIAFCVLPKNPLKYVNAFFLSRFCIALYRSNHCKLHKFNSNFGCGAPSLILIFFLCT